MDRDKLFLPTEMRYGGEEEGEGGDDQMMLDALVRGDIPPSRLPPHLVKMAKELNASFEVPNEAVAELFATNRLPIARVDEVEQQIQTPSHASTKNFKVEVERTKRFCASLRAVLVHHGDIFTWLPNSQDLVVLNTTAAERRVFPRHFPDVHTYKSFDRKLRRNGFKRVTRKGLSEYMMGHHGVTGFRIYNNPKFNADEVSSEY